MTSAPPDFFWGYLPFWIINYSLAIVIWSCLGRFLLAFFVPAIQPSNYIWRAFTALTGWAVHAVRYVTPGMVGAIWLAPIAAFWLYHLRIAVFLIMWSQGWTPGLAPAGPVAS